jgi:hypothetical protein
MTMVDEGRRLGKHGSAKKRKVSDGSKKRAAVAVGGGDTTHNKKSTKESKAKSPNTQPEPSRPSPIDALPVDSREAAETLAVAGTALHSTKKKRKVSTTMR